MWRSSLVRRGGISIWNSTDKAIGDTGSDGVAGESSSFPSEIMWILHPSTWSKAGTMRSQRRRHRTGGMPVHISRSCCGTRTILPCTSRTVRLSESRTSRARANGNSCTTSFQCRGKRLGVHSLPRTQKALCTAMGRQNETHGRGRLCHDLGIYPNLQRSDRRLVAQSLEVKNPRSLLQAWLTDLQLQFEEGDRHGRSQKSGCNMLFEFLTTISLLHKRISKSA